MRAHLQNPHFSVLTSTLTGMADRQSAIPSEVIELFSSFASIPHLDLQKSLSQPHHAQGLISLLLSTLQSLAATSILSFDTQHDPASKHATKIVLNLIYRLLELEVEVEGKGKQQGEGLVGQLRKDSACLNLCLAAEPCYPKAVRRVIGKLADANQAHRILSSVQVTLKQRMIELKNTAHSSIALASILTSVRMISRLSPIMKLVDPDSDTVLSLVGTLAECYDESLPRFADSQPAWKSLHQQDLLENCRLLDFLTIWLEVKTEILSTVQLLLRLFKSKASPASFSKLLKLSSSFSTAISPLSSHLRAPLISLSLPADLFLVDPSLLKHTFPDSASLDLLFRAKDEAHSALKAIGHSNGLTFTMPKFAGPAWELLKSRAQSLSDAPISSTTDKGKGKARALDDDLSEPQVDPALLELVSSILPDLVSDVSGQAGLKIRLGSKRYAGKSSEEVIQMLLDEQENGIQEADILIPEMNELEIRSPTPPTFETHQKPKRTAISSRANVFDQQPIDMSKLRWKGSTQEGEQDQSMSNNLKAQILARVEAQEKEQLEEEWDLEGEGRMSGARRYEEVGFEEELENAEPTGIHRRQGISVLGGANGQARDWNRRLEDLSDDDDEEDDQDHDLSAMEGKGQPVKSTTENLQRDPTSNVERERNDERILVKAWSALGEGAFNKEARKSKDRKNLLAELSNGWDDHRVESWATMFNRNPRKDKLLNAATDLLAPNLNRAPATTDQQHSDNQSSRFGPDRGRGGRLPREGGRGGSETQTSSRGGSGSGGSGARGRGTHSGNDRGARNKEKRGNVARQRGFDRKAARGAAGTGGL